MRLSFLFGFLALWSEFGAAAQPPAPKQFLVIVHPSNPLPNLGMADLRAMYGGHLTHWPDGKRVVLVHRTSGSPPNHFLMDRLLRTSWQDYKRSLENIEFTGQEPAIVRVLNSDAAACKFVFNVPSAVAVIEASSVAAPECRDVKVLKIDGLAQQRGYRPQ